MKNTMLTYSFLVVFLLNLLPCSAARTDDPVQFLGIQSICGNDGCYYEPDSFELQRRSLKTVANGSQYIDHETLDTFEPEDSYYNFQTLSVDRRTGFIYALSGARPQSLYRWNSEGQNREVLALDYKGHYIQALAWSHLGGLVGVGVNHTTRQNDLLVIEPEELLGGRETITVHVKVLTNFTFDSGYWQPSSFVVDPVTPHAYAISSSGSIHKFKTAQFLPPDQRVEVTTGNLLAAYGSRASVQVLKIRKDGSFVGMTYNATGTLENEIFIATLSGTTTIVSKIKFPRNFWSSNSFVYDMVTESVFFSASNSTYINGTWHQQYLLYNYPLSTSEVSYQQNGNRQPTIFKSDSSFYLSGWVVGGLLPPDFNVTINNDSTSCPLIEGYPVSSLTRGDPGVSMVSEGKLGKEGLIHVFSVRWNETAIFRPNSSKLELGYALQRWNDFDLRMSERSFRNPRGISQILLEQQSSLTTTTTPAISLTVVSGGPSAASSVTYFYLQIPALGGEESFSLDVDESIEIVLLPAFFHCGTEGIGSEGVVVAAVEVSNDPDEAAEAVRTTMVATVGTSVVTGGLAGGAAAAIDAQSLALIGMMSCVLPAEKKMTENLRLLSPLATEESFQGMIIGNLILVGGLLVLQGIGFVVFRYLLKIRGPDEIEESGLFTVGQKRSPSKSNESDSDSERRQRSWMEASSAVRFPALALVAACLTQQGTGAASIQLLQGGDGSDSGSGTDLEGEDILLAVLGLTLSFGLPVVMILLQLSSVNAYFGRFEFASPPGICARLALPEGRWFPDTTKKSLGPLFSSVGKPLRIWGLQCIWSPTLVLLISSFRPGNRDGCIAQFSVLAAIQFLLALSFFVCRPLRSIPANALSGLASLCLGVIFAASASLVKDPQSLSTDRLIAAAVQCLLVLTVLRTLYMLFVVICEKFYLNKMAHTVAFKWTPFFLFGCCSSAFLSAEQIKEHGKKNTTEFEVHLDECLLGDIPKARAEADISSSPEQTEVLDDDPSRKRTGQEHLKKPPHHHLVELESDSDDDDLL